MKPKRSAHKNRQRDLFRPELATIIDPGHGLVKLAKAVNWNRMQYRCAKPDFYLRPGDMAIYGPHELTIGTITCIISPSSQYMEVAEAQV